MARWCGSSTSAERVGELGSSGAAAAAAGQEAGRQAKWSGGVGLRARARTALKAGRGWSEQASPLAVGVRAPRGGRACGEGGLRAGAAAAWAWAGEAHGRRGREPGRLRPWAESEAAAREGEKPFFIYIFKKH